MKKYSTPIQIHLISGLTTNESLFYSTYYANQFVHNPLQTTYSILTPYISRVSLNKIKKILVTKKFLTEETYLTLIDPISLPEPLRATVIHTKMGRPTLV